MDSKDDSSSSLLFSPLPSHQSTPAQNSTPSQTHTPTPLTISAHTIEGDSKDFTEYANLDITPTPLTKPHPQHTSTHTNSSLNKENMLTTPISSAPIRVRVSAKKLREIQSPYNSSSSSSLGRGSPLLDSFKMDHPPPTLTDNQGRTGSVESSSIAKKRPSPVTCEGVEWEGPSPVTCEGVEQSTQDTSSVPGALTPPGGHKKQVEMKAKTTVDKIKAGQLKTLLPQGVLQPRVDPPGAGDTSSESVLIQTDSSQTDKPSVQSSRDQLLHRKSGTSKSKSQFCVYPVVTKGMSVPPGYVSPFGRLPAVDQDIKVSQSSALPVWECQFHEGTAKLVATCTAAATAALLATKQNPDKSRPPQSDGQAGESSTSCLLPSQTQSEVPKQVSSDVTGHERKPDLVSRVDQMSFAKTRMPQVQVLDGQQSHSNHQTLPNANTSRQSPQVQSNGFTASRRHFDNEGIVLSEPFKDRYPKGGGKGPHPHYVYSDLVARVNRMEELQHSQLMRIAKGPQRSGVTEMSEDRRSQEKRFAYLVRDEGCQTSPLGHLPTGMADSSWKDALKSRASSEGPDRMARCLEAEANDSAVELQKQSAGISKRILKDNSELSRSSAHLSREPSPPDTRPQPFESITARPARLPDSEPQRDGLLNVARMLSDVQQARANIELECALEEAQAQYTDLGVLLQSEDKSKEFTDVTWKVAKLFERAYQDGLEGEKTQPSDMEIVEPSGGKPVLKTSQRKKNVKTGRASKASDQETRQKPVSSLTKVRTNKLSSQPTRVGERSSSARSGPLSHPTKSNSLWQRQTVSTRPPLHTTLPTPQGTTSTTLTHHLAHAHIAPPHPVLSVSTNTSLTAPSAHTVTTFTASPSHSITTLTAQPSHTVTTLTAPHSRPVVPIGPPCVIPSPIYTIHEPTPLPSPPLPISKADKFTSTHSPPPHAHTKEKAAVVTVDACLQTSFSQSSESCLDSETSRRDEREESVGTPQEVDSSSEPSSVGSEKGYEPAVTIPGSHRSPPPTPQPPLPSHHTHGVREQVTSEELSDRLQEQLESRAVEWMRQEVMMRMLSQAKLPLSDPVTDSRPFDLSNSCSTCSLDSPRSADGGAQLPTDPTQSANKESMLSAVKEAVKEELISLAQEVAKTANTEQRVTEDDDQYSYTPPESYTLSTTSLSATEPLPLSTPRPTPPTSHTPSPDHTLTGEGLESLSTPTLTPPLLKNPSPPTLPIETVVDTPQISMDESSVSESAHKTTTISDHTHLDVMTPLATPTPIPPSVPSPPQPTEPTTVTPLTAHTPHTPHTKELSSSDTSTTSTSSHPHSLTSTDSSTDRGISMGECVQRRPWLPHTNSSLSEGEVPLSPGDVRWGSLFARTVKTDPAGEALLELKNSGDSISDSQESDLPHQDFSVGEVGKPRPLAVPFERFLHKVNTSTPDDSSSCGRGNSSTENTLSELPSLNLDHPSHLVSDVTPPVKRPKKSGHRKTKGSPGEVIHLSMKGKMKSKNDSSVSYPHSEGELPPRITLLNKETRLSAVQDVSTVNETRGGIDVINVSRLSSKHSKPDTSSSEHEDTLASISQISVRSSPNIPGMPKVIRVQPATRTQDQVEPEPAVSTQRKQEPLKMLSLSSTEDLPLNINLSELELTDTLTKPSNDLHSVTVSPSHQATAPPLPSPQRASITVTIPVASQEVVGELKSGESYSSDFEFSSSMSIPIID